MSRPRLRQDALPPSTGRSVAAGNAPFLEEVSS